MIPRPRSRAVLTRSGLAALMALAIPAGCGGKTQVNDTAEVTPSKAPAEPARSDAPAPAPEPAKDAPKD